MPVFGGKLEVELVDALYESANTHSVLLLVAVPNTCMVTESRPKFDEVGVVRQDHTSFGGCPA